MSEKLTRTQIKNLERFGGVNPADQSFSRRQFALHVGGFALAAGGAVRADFCCRIGGAWKASSHRHQSDSRTMPSRCRLAGQT